VTRRPAGTGVVERRRRILAVVARIPSGRVASYGQVAALAGLPGHAREVGRVLSGLAETSEAPWQRVVNAAGRVSPRGLFGDETHQRRLLEAEGVRFDARGRIDLERHGWEPRTERLRARRPGR
jgi:methylated-DNA-protein-cysteine methyltransferase-like protein